jgi:hypothetical protein
MTTPLTADELARIRALVDEYAALPITGVQALPYYQPTLTEQLADAVPALLTEIERLTAELDRLRNVRIAFNDAPIRTLGEMFDAPMIDINKDFAAQIAAEDDDQHASDEQS